MASMIGSGLYDCLLGSRILGDQALEGGMPLWKYVSVTGVLIYFLPSDSTNIISIAPTSITPVSHSERCARC